MNAKILESTVNGILLYNYARCSTIHTAKEQYFFQLGTKKAETQKGAVPKKAIYHKYQIFYRVDPCILMIFMLLMYKCLT